MHRLVQTSPRRARRAHKACRRFLLFFTVTGLLSGCIAKVQIPAVDHFRIASGQREGIIDPGAHEEILLKQLYQLMKANAGVEVPICTAARDSGKCIKDGVRVFVLGGIIPGVGKRTGYSFSEIALDDHQLEFTKDNSRTTFIGTPMMTRDNKCRVHVAAGGLQAEMTNYYANWAGIGNMFMAEGWAIDYLDLNRGIVGMQLELDIKGYFTMGGGSRYVLLKFPNIPASLSPPATHFDLLERE